MTGDIGRAVEKKAELSPAEQKRRAMRELITKNLPQLGLSLPRGMDQDRFGRILMTAAVAQPKLMETTPASFILSALWCAQMGLEPNDPRGLAYLIPYGTRCQLVIGYRGMVDTMYRTKIVASITAEPVYEGDDFEWELGTDGFIRHRPSGEDRDDALTHAYAIAKTTTGGTIFKVLPRKALLKTRDQSASAKRDDSPWHTHFAAMCRKTPIRRIASELPSTPMVAELLRVDDTDRDLTVDDIEALDPMGLIDTTAEET